MADSVYIPLPVTTVQEAAERPSRTYHLDLETGRILGFVDGQEAVRQAIHKAIITPRWKCLIYTIVSEATGQGATLWGKLKSGIGWVSLDYCKKI